MNRAHHNKTNYRLAISWILVAAMLALTLFPYHYHLHHDDQPSPTSIGAQDHAIEFHSVLDIVEADHQHDDHTIDSSTDIALKSMGVQLPFIVLILSLLLPLPSFTRVDRRRYVSASHKLPNAYRHKVPPLRAPPLH